MNDIVHSKINEQSWKQLFDLMIGKSIQISGDYFYDTQLVRQQI